MKGRTRLTLKHSVDIRPHATVEVEVNELVEVVPAAVGIFFIRKALGLKGVDTPNSGFKDDWEGTNPTIVLINSGVNVVELRKGDELGELFFFPHM